MRPLSPQPASPFEQPPDRVGWPPGGAGGGALPGPRGAAVPGATLGPPREHGFCRKEPTQKIRVQGGHPLQPHPHRCGYRLPTFESRVGCLDSQRGEVGGGGGCLRGAVSSGEILRSAKPKSRGGPEWPRGLRLSVLRGGSPRPRPPVSDLILISDRKLAEEGSEDEGDDGHELDEDVHAGPRGVFEGVADGVAHHGGLVGL